MPEVASPRSRITHPSAWPIAVKLGGSYVSEILAGVSTKLPGVYLANAVKHEARGVVGVAVLKLSSEVVTRMVDDVHTNPGGVTRRCA
jgi:hypothetical protein